MKKKIATLRAARSVSIEVPSEVKEGKEHRAIERSCYGALRFFPDLPRAISEDELAYLEKHHPEVYRKLEIRPYVESRRKDVRGLSEAEVEAAARSERIGHLPSSKQVELLRSRGKMSRPRKRETASKLEGGVKNPPKAGKKEKSPSN